MSFNYGAAGINNPDWPVIGDWNGDGIDTPGVYRFTISTFFMSVIANGQPVGAGNAQAYGSYGDAPLVGHWFPGNSADTIAISRISSPWP